MEIWQCGRRKQGCSRRLQTKKRCSLVSLVASLAWVLGWSHCWWKPGPVGAMQAMLKGWPDLTVSELAFTSTSKSSSSAGGSGEQQGGADVSHITSQVTQIVTV